LSKDLTKNKKDSMSKSLFRYFPEAKKMLIGDKVTTTKLEQLGKSIFDNPASRFAAR
jgi:hypothetical protein